MKKALLFIISLVVAKTMVFADESILKKIGIDPDVLNSVTGNMNQNRGYISRAQVTTTSEDKTKTDDVYVIFEPDTEYGIDLYIKYDASKKKISDSKRYLKLLDKMMRVRHRQRVLGDSYDPQSIKMIEENESKKLIKYRYQSGGVPQDIAFFRHFDGEVLIENKKLISISLENNRSFDYDFFNVHYAKVVTHFTQLEDGTYVIKGSDLNVKGHSWGKLFSMEIVQNFIQYDNNSGETEVIRPDLVKDLSDPKFESVRVNLGRTFPLFGNETRKMGYDLPLPFGVMGTYRWQTMDMRFTHFEINGSDFFENIFETNSSTAIIDTESKNVRIDMFVFPFLNIYALAGSVKSDAKLTLDTTKLGGIVLPDTIELDLELDTDMAGLGVTGAVGYKNFFAALNATWSHSLTKQSGTSTTIWVVQPMIGYQIPDYRMRLLAGAEYQGFNSAMVGDLGPNFHFDVGVDTEKWSGLIGLQKEFGTNLEAIFLYTYGKDRESFTVNFGYRF